MRRISAVILFFFVAVISAYAQKKLNQKPKQVEWADQPYLHSVPPEYAGEPAVVLLQDVDIDYKFEGRHTVAYYTYHRIIKVLDDKGIESFNTIGFSVGSRTRVPLVKARTITSNGRVQEIAKDMIKVTRDEMGRYKVVVAMEGVEKNSEIEILVKEIRPGYHFGGEIFQMPVPIVSAHFRMSYPKDLLFEEKGFNGFPALTEVLSNNRRHLDASLSDIPALTPEPYSFYDRNCMRVEYRMRNYIDENDWDTLRTVDTWEDMARSMFDEYYKITDTERKAVNTYLTELGVHPGENEMENIRKIENGIKTGIVLYPYVDNGKADMLDTVIAKKAATTKGYIKLFVACLTQAQIKHELGMAGDRAEYSFDTKFPNWDNLDYHVIYFPNQKKYLSPASIYFRCPVIPSNITSTKGVFCTIPPHGSIYGPMVDIHTIKPLAPAENGKNISAALHLSDSMDAKLDISYAYSGYASTDLRSKLLLQTKDKEKELVDKLVTVADRPTDILSYTITNDGIENYYSNKPLEITASVNANSLVEKAGKQYLLKIGEIIGDHSQLYTDKKRVMPIDLPYPQSFTRTITINIPKGYKIVNPEAARMEAEYIDRNLTSLISFKSDYSLVTDKKTGDKLVVTVTENYPQVHFPVADYERFRQVVNTGADFNKVALLLAKKGQM